MLHHRSERLGVSSIPSLQRREKNLHSTADSAQYRRSRPTIFAVSACNRGERRNYSGIRNARECECDAKTHTRIRIAGESDDGWQQFISNILLVPAAVPEEIGSELRGLLANARMRIM